VNQAVCSAGRWSSTPTSPDIGASAKSVLYGDFSGYYIRDVGTVRFERSDEFAFDK
jgi:HK97 family phage major capsid protein